MAASLTLFQSLLKCQLPGGDSVVWFSTWVGEGAWGQTEGLFQRENEHDVGGISSLGQSLPFSRLQVPQLVKRGLQQQSPHWEQNKDVGQRQRPLSTNGINVNDLNDIVIKGKGGIHDVARFLAWQTYVSLVKGF